MQVAVQPGRLQPQPHPQSFGGPLALLGLLLRQFAPAGLGVSLPEPLAALVFPIPLGGLRLLVGRPVADRERLAHQHPPFRRGVPDALPLVDRDEPLDEDELVQRLGQVVGLVLEPMQVGQHEGRLDRVRVAVEVGGDVFQCLQPADLEIAQEDRRHAPVVGPLVRTLAFGVGNCPQAA